MLISVVRGAAASTGTALRLGVLLGARANAWHSEVFRALPAEVAATIIGTTRPRYPTSEIGLPLLALPYQDERGPWLARKWLHLRYRLTHRWTGYEFPLDPPAGALAPFDVLFTWELFTDWTRIALDERRRRGVPVAVVVWDNLAGHYAGEGRRGRLRARALAEADRFYVLTGLSARALIADGVAPGRIRSGRPSIDPARFAPGHDSGWRERLGVGGGEQLLLCVARLEAEKGVRYLLQAFAALPAGGSRIRLAVVGDGPERAPLERLSRELGIATRTRFVTQLAHDEMPALHRAADLFVLPSVPTSEWQEQWGQSLLEAMATGTPSIASNCGGIPELVGDEGAALLVPAGDAGALGRAIASLLADGEARRRLGEAARARVLREFSQGDEADRLAALVRELAGAGGQRG